MLKIENLHASVDNKTILQSFNLEVLPGSVHAVMGPNGSGKSTFSYILAGHPKYKVTKGHIKYEVDLNEKDLLTMSPDMRAKQGVFLAFQYPVEIPGVTNFSLLQASFNAICKHQGVKTMNSDDFLHLLKTKANLVGLNTKFFDRPVNEGFSGGEKKRNEILQMLVLNPCLAILDETDSGLDVDSLKIVAKGINQFRNKQNALILITHYQRLLNYVRPDYVHILFEGKIIKSGDMSLVEQLEKDGYESFKKH